ncbi:MAG: hypothetical protein AM326_08565 [Candidatus Thorarchaeota archaeon SMTZ-45]|nr:MAG: hypothetical protein AM326_08565 [Candidatus Thorarchaeota archaeon SMTZ-45]
MNNKENKLRYLREMDDSEIAEWRAAPKSSLTRVFEDFLFSEIKMAEIMTNDIPLKETGVTVKSTKADRVASSFYAWKRKKHTQAAMQRLGIEEIILIRRGEKLALKKKMHTRRKK